MKRTLLLLIAALSVQAQAAEPVAIRFGGHGSFDRVVFEFATDTKYSVEQAPESAVIHFTAKVSIPDLHTASATIKGVRGGDSVATVALAPGAELKFMQIDRRIVLDVRPAHTATVAPGLVSPKQLSPSTAKQAPPPSKVTPAVLDDKARPIPPRVLTSSVPARSSVDVAEPNQAVAVPAPVIAVAQTNAVSVQPNQSPSTPDRPAVAPISLDATVIDTSLNPGATAVLLPFDQDVGAAAFRHEAEAWIVFDEARPIEAASFQDQPAFAGATVQVLPAGTVLRLPLQRDQRVGLRRVAKGWIVTIGSSPGPTGTAILPSVQADRLVFPVGAVGHVVAVTDRGTGENLQVGTLRATSPGVPVPYRAPEFNILPSWQGVVAEFLSDRASLRDIPEGFAVETGMPLSPTSNTTRAFANAAVLTRRFDFPALPVPSLLHRLQAQMADQGAAPPQGRLLPREAAAQTMIALGMGPEAESLLQLAEAEDPHASDDPDVQGLIGIAALLSGRLSEADGILNPGLDGSDEVSLWRAVLAADRQDASPAAASMFSTSIKLILSYPTALRDRLLPLAAETMANGGATAAADELLTTLQDEPRLALARAIRFEAKGDAAGARSLYKALAMGRDRLVSARAAARAVRLDLTTHTISPAEAADELERGFLDWRGDARERDLRLEVVDLRAKAGQWRRAFSLLRETAALYPEDMPAFRDRTTKLLTTLLRDDQASSISPLDLVTLAEENAEEAAKAAPDEVTALLADRLMALDLPKQAEPVFERMMMAAADGPGKATLGASLASIRLGEGDVSGAEAALSASDAPSLPAALAEQRGLLSARLRAKSHDVTGASAILASLNTAAADDLRSTILADAGDWRGSEASLRSLTDRSVPATGQLTPFQQDLLLRLASAEARAGDDDAARDLGVRESSRVLPPRSDMFRLLTAAAVSGPGDLQRSAGELAMARSIPAALAAIGGH